MANLDENMETFIRMASKRKGLQSVSVGVAVNVDAEDRTCDIRLNDDLTLFGCRLNAIIDNYESNVLLLPKEGSFVAYTLIDDRDTEVLVIAYSEIETIKIKTGETTIEITDGKITLNGGTFGGLIKIEELKTQLAKNTARLDGIIDALQTSATGTQDGGAAYKAGIAAALSALTDKENYGNIEDEKITH